MRTSTPVTSPFLRFGSPFLLPLVRQTRIIARTGWLKWSTNTSVCTALCPGITETGQMAANLEEELSTSIGVNIEEHQSQCYQRQLLQNGCRHHEFWRVGSSSRPLWPVDLWSTKERRKGTRECDTVHLISVKDLILAAPLSVILQQVWCNLPFLTIEWFSNRK